MYLSRKTVSLTTAVVAMLLLGVFAPTAYAADSCTTEEQSLWDKIQAAGSEAVDYIDEHKDGWIESAKEGAEKASEKIGGLYDSAKEAAPGLIDKAKDSVSNAHDQFSEWNAGQQDQFWDWFEDQTGVGSNPATAAPDNDDDTTIIDDGLGDSASDSSENRPSTPLDPPVSSATPETPVTEAPGYAFSEDGQSVIIDGKEYTHLSDSDKVTLANGQVRAFLIKCVGLPILALCVLTLIIVHLADAYRHRKRRH